MPEYNALRFCCNWAVHVKLSHSQAQKIVKMADAFYPKLLKGELTEPEMDQFRSVFSLGAFRGELNQFLADKNLPGLSDTQWNTFLACFLNTKEDCPLRCEGKGANTSEVDEVVLIKEVGDEDRPADGNPPRILWALCFQEHPRFTIGANFTLFDEVVDAAVDFRRRRNPQAATEDA
jgi:hypothetical protein